MFKYPLHKKKNHLKANDGELENDKTARRIVKQRRKRCSKWEIDNRDWF